MKSFLLTITQLIERWEEGHDIVCAVKTGSEENPFVRFARSCYYRLIHRMSNIEQIEHFTGSGLYDRSFIDVLRTLDDPQPFLRGIVAELGPANRIDVPYTQQKRRAGRTHNNLATLYDAAMLSFTSYTKAPLRIATIGGFVFSLASLVMAVVFLILKLTNWDAYPMGMAPLIISLFFIGSVQTFFIGLLGEYVLTINSRTMKRPLVIEEERLGIWESPSSNSGLEDNEK